MQSISTTTVYHSSKIPVPRIYNPAKIFVYVRAYIAENHNHAQLAKRSDKKHIVPATMAHTQSML